MVENFHVLIIDDDPKFINTLSLLLGREGCEVLCTNTGKAGIDAIKKFEPDIILLNAVLPDCNGSELGMSIKGNCEFSEILVILLNEGNFFHEDPKLLECGYADGCISKTGTENELQHQLHLLLQLKQLGKALQKSEKRYHGLLASLETGVVVHSKDSSIVSCNPRAAELLGLSMEQMLGKVALDPYWKFIDEDAHPIPIEEYPVMQIIRSGKPIRNQVFGVYTQDGLVKWLIVNGFPVVDPRGSVEEILISFIDISERKRAEMLLQQDRAMLNTILNSIPQSVFWKDREIRYLGCNMQFAKAAGMASPEAIIGKTDFDLPWPKAEAEAYRDDDRYVMDHNASKFHIVEPLQQEDGHRLWIDTTKVPLLDAHGSVTGVLGVYEDITERKRTEEALQESEEKFRSIFENAPLGIFRSTSNGKFVEVNATLANLLGFASPKVAIEKISNLFEQIFVRSEEGKDLIALQNREPGVRQSIHTFQRIDGTQFTGNLILKPILAADGTPLFFDGIVEDITRRKQAEAERALLYNTLENSLNEIYIFNGGTLKFQYVNAGALNNLQFSLEEMRQMTPVDIKPDFSEADFLQIIAPLKTGEKEVLVFETNHQRANGSLYPVEVRLQFFMDDQVFLAVIQDITEHRKTEFELITAKEKAESNEIRLIEAQSVTKVGSWETDLTTLDVFWSDETYKIFELIPSEFSPDHNTFLEFVHPLDRDKVDDAFKNSFNTGLFNQVEHRIISAKGNVKYVEERWRIIRNNTGDPIKAFGTCQDITERKLSEFELINAKERAEENARKLKEAQEIAKMGSWELDIKTRVFTFTDNFYRIFHTSAQEMGGYQMSLEDYARQFVHPLDASKVASETQLAIENPGSSFEKYLEHRILYRDGGIGYIGVRFFVEKDDFGTIIKTFGVNQDITDKKNAEFELLKATDIATENQIRLNQALEISRAGIYDWNIIENTFYWSEEFLQIFGMPLDTVAGFDAWQKALHPDDLEVASSRIQESIEAQSELMSDYRIILPNGEVRWIRATGKVFYDQNVPLRMIGLCIDITENKHAEVELRIAKDKAEESERKIKEQNFEVLFQNERLESLLKISQYHTNSIQELLDFALSEAVSLTRSKIGYIYYYIEEKEQFILNSWSRDVMQDCSVLNPQAVYDLDSTGCWGEAVRQRKPIIMNDYPADNPIKKGTPDGHVALEKFLTIPVIFDDKIVAVAGVANKQTDYNDSDIRQLTLLMDNVWKISERLILISDLQSAKLQAEESDRLKSAFLANMSHEIRTPMNGILGFAELLKEPDLTGAEQHNFIEMIEKSGQRMLNIINDIIDISKIEAGLMKLNISEFHIGEQVEFVYTFFKQEAAANGIELVKNYSHRQLDMTLKSDKEKFLAILTNLVKNAIKFTEKGEVELGCSKKGQTLEFFVRDTGIGIPEERMNTIFERFMQVDVEDSMARQGAGLGLSITKTYVEMMGGQIWAQSEVGKGSAFYFSLPSNATRSGPMHQSLSGLPGEDAYSNSFQLNILIVEDDEASGRILEINLKKIARLIRKVNNGPDAVETVRSHPDIDLILMDIRLPGLTGYDATRQIRQFNKNVVIIAQTAYGLTGDREQAIAAGCNDYIAKPIISTELLALIKKYFS